MNKAEEKKPGPLLKVDTIRKNSYAANLLLKTDDIIVALNNEFFDNGEKIFTEILQDIKREKKKTILTIIRNDIFLEIIVEKSLGCKFLTTDEEETKKIKDLFLKKKIYDIDELKEFGIMRDLKNNYDIIHNSKSLVAGFFPPLWLAYENQWILLSFFSVLSLLLISVNLWTFLIGWLILSIYCYKAQTNLLYSFSLLTGKAFSLKFACKDIHEAHLIIRRLNPNSKFKFSKLENPNSPDEEIEKNSKLKEKNVMDESNKILV